MQPVIYLRLIPGFIILSLTACTGATQSPTLAPTFVVETQAATESAPTPTEIPVKASPAASATSALGATAPTQSMTLFTESGGGYTVNLTPADFVDVVDNSYFPLPAGAKWEYEIRVAGKATQTDTIEVLKDRKNVNGVQATVVRDTVSSGKKIVEDTFDWFAQDKYGNVWYVGESVDNYVGGVLAGHAGSWEWGVDGAQPGIIMWADPSAHLDQKYRQEYYAGKAEDMGQVLSTDESLAVPFGSFDQVLKTLDFSNIEAGQEQKFYAPGIGLLKEMDVNGNEEVVLTNMIQPAP